MSPNPQELKGLVDSTPDKSVLLNLTGFYAKRQLPEKGVDSDVVYDCPRTQVMVRTAVKGTQIGAHFHTVSDEVVIVVGGRGEVLINGEWKPVKQGDVHVSRAASSTTLGPWRRICSTSRSSPRTCRRAPISTGSSEPSLRRL